MDKKNLISHANTSLNPTTTAELPIEIVEMSDEDLQQLVGGMNYQLYLEWVGDDN
jgi:hypothetical protein